MTEPSLPEESIFGQALEIASAAERAAFLDRACANNPALRAEVEALLRSHERSGDLLDLPENLPVTTDDLPAREGPGTVIGPYKLLEQIGEGGMGTVWMAEQTEPIQRRVAVKVVKEGMGSRQVLARFEAERQALALMEHPNIAKVLDAGKAPSGRPYFVMELVKGQPITKHCDKKRLGVRERLELFGDVCRAVQHAHQKGIIHRDLKPSNVLVAPFDGRPVVKVIDFGVAKATGQRLTDKTLFTGFGALVGTPEYMSPEQAEVNNQDIDTRSDIYSLGVLLYELLTGSTPLTRQRIEEAALLEVLRVIREDDPPKPSTRLSESKDSLPSISAQRQTEPAKLTRLVRGELDWLVMKALEKDRNRRYETANGFATDIQRYLSDEPVQACPPSASYRLRKFARKYRMPLRLAAVLAVVLVLATAVSTWQAVRATRERDRAEASFRMTREAVDRLFTQVSQSPKLKAQGMEKFRKELLQTAREFHERFVREQFDSPGLRNDLGLAHRRLAEINRELGEYAAAQESATQAIAILGQLAAAEPHLANYQHDLAVAHTVLGSVHADRAHWGQALEEYQKAVSIQEPLTGTHPEVAAYQYALAKTYAASGLAHARTVHWDLAAGCCRKAFDLLDRLVRQHPGVYEYQALLAATRMRLGEAMSAASQYDEAEGALKEAASAFERLLSDQPDAPPQDRASLAICHSILGYVYKATGQSGKAEVAQQQALEVFEALARAHREVPEFTYGVARCYFALADTAHSAGRLDAAVVHYGKAIDTAQAAMDRGYDAAGQMLLNARINRATVIARQGDHAQASREAKALAGKALDELVLYNLSCALAQSAVAAAQDTRLAPADRARLQTQYADQAMDYLCQAVSKGWANWRLMENDPDIKPLHARKDFGQLLADVKAKTKQP